MTILGSIVVLLKGKRGTSSETFPYLPVVDYRDLIDRYMNPQCWISGIMHAPTTGVDQYGNNCYRQGGIHAEKTMQVF